MFNWNWDKTLENVLFKQKWSDWKDNSDISVYDIS